MEWYDKRKNKKYKKCQNKPQRNNKCKCWWRREPKKNTSADDEEMMKAQRTGPLRADEENKKKL